MRRVARGTRNTHIAADSGRGRSIDATIAPAKWSGNAVFLMPKDEHFKEVAENENAVCSIYPGYIVARPRGTEILIAYGQSEYRWATGTDYVTRVARIVERRAELLTLLARTHDEGDKKVRFTRGA